jgi:hypothetical protein
MKNATILLAPSYEMALNIKAPEITIEAEYGDKVVEGTKYTAAHHGPRANRPAPCVDRDLPAVSEGGTILISHIDLDTLGGISRAIQAGATHEEVWYDSVMGHEFQPSIIPDSCYFKVRDDNFWGLVAYVDVNGPHKLQAAVRDDNPHARALFAYWAWAEANRGDRKDPSKVHDVTAEVLKHLSVIARILRERDRGGEGPYHAAGREWRNRQVSLNRESFVEWETDWRTDRLIIRKSDQFVNHLYEYPDDPTRVATAVIAFNTKTGTVTLSFAEKDDPRNAAAIMKVVFGPAAGGHKGIAGSPRGLVLEAPAAETAIAKILAKICR